MTKKTFLKFIQKTVRTCSRLLKLYCLNSLSYKKITNVKILSVILASSSKKEFDTKNLDIPGNYNEGCIFAEGGKICSTTIINESESLLFILLKETMILEQLIS